MELVNQIVTEARSHADLMLGIDWEPLKSYIWKELKSFAIRGFVDPSYPLAERITDQIHQTSPFEEQDDKEIFEQFIKSALDKVVDTHGVRPHGPPSQVFSSDWLEYLRVRGILLDPKDELDWSGRGQHIEFAANEANEIPVQSEKILGHSATALVESVRCRRIRLARKIVRCNRRLSKEDAITEVEHLQRLSHSHIVRVIGTYTLRRDLAILLYPAAEWNLEEFMDDTVDLENNPEEMVDLRRLATATFIGCLARTIRFLHSENVKHMDIKPKNILVRTMGPASIKGPFNIPWKVYLADFGIARAYQTAAEADTESPTSYTRTYAAPEVVLQEKRGLSADIFSLGCVFMEMTATLASRQVHGQNERHRLQSIRTKDDSDTSYQANIDAIQHWFRQKRIHATQWITPMGLTPMGDFIGLEALFNILPQMIDKSPSQRPLAWEIAACAKQMYCASCSDGPEPFEAARPWAN
ncbi:hypothetical protein N0V90_009783 [Kalmusia sp. IMI 367209]|nr:hypothetical protein N0V90_009783 [Kalmusia sp. IMI 367209]